MTASVAVRPAAPSDREAVLALAPRLTEGVAAWRDADAVGSAVRGWVEESLATAGSDDSTVLVAETGAEVAGFCSVAVREHWASGADAYIGELVVDKRHEGRGVGRALVDAATRWARQRGLTGLTLETGAANTAARAFYGRLGFAEEDVRLTLVLGDG